ncbi:hypothetical protein ACLOJK_034995, partial [Asimina triloba]
MCIVELESVAPHRQYDDRRGYGGGPRAPGRHPPRTGPTTHRQSILATQISTENLAAPPLFQQKPVEHAVSWTGFERVRRQDPVGHSVSDAVEQVLTELVDRTL